MTETRRNDPVWLDDLPEPRVDSLPADAEVVIVGGGVAGCALCYWLARARIRVVLLERARIGGGASGRNAGLFLPSGSPLEDPTITAGVLARETIDAGFRRTGHLALATTPRIWDRVREEATRSTRVFALDREHCESLLGTPIDRAVHGGRWYPAGGMLHPARFVRGLALVAAEHGAALLEESSCHGFSRTSDGLTVETNRGVVTTKRLVVACGAATPKIATGLSGTLRQAAAHMTLTSRLAPLFGPALAVDWGDVYWRQLPDGALLVGGELPRGHPLRRARERRQDAVLRRLFPELGTAKIAREWEGVMDLTHDGRPLVGQCGPHSELYVMCGFGGHGLPPALGYARALARTLLGGDAGPLEHASPTRKLPAIGAPSTQAEEIVA